MPATRALQPRTTADNLRLQSTLREIVEQRGCFHTVLGVKASSFDPRMPQLSFDMRPQLIGHFDSGRLHGGVIAAALDAAAGFAIALAVAERHAAESVEKILARLGRLSTIDLRVDYLHPGLGKCFVAGATINRIGERIAAVQMHLHNEANLLIATGAAAYLIS